MNTREIYGVVVIIVILLTSGLAFGASPSKNLTVGLSASMSGQAAAWGLVHERACTLAIEDINAKGGITVGGEKYILQLKTYDHAYDPSRSVEIAKRMMMVDKVAWIVTHGTTAVKPIIPFTEENRTIIMHGGLGTDIMVFQKQSYTFRFLMSAPEGYFIVWQWVSKNYPQLKTTVEMQPDDASGWDLMKDIKEKVLPKYGIKLAVDMFYKRGMTEFYPILIKLLAAKPDVFDLANIPPADQGRVMKQAREMGYKGQFIAPVLSSYGPALEIAGPASEGLIFGAYVDPSSAVATPEEKKFYDRWMKSYGPPFDLLSMSVITGVYPVAQAIEKANSFDPDKVAKVLQTTKFNVLGRTIRIGGAGAYGPPPRTIISPYAIYKVEGGKPKLIEVAEMAADY